MKNASKYSSILTYHTNTFGCGVAKFNNILAKKIGCEMHQIFSKYNKKKRVLISIKLSEFEPNDKIRLRKLLTDISNFDVFFHDFSFTNVEQYLIKKAKKIICGNQEISKKILRINPLYKNKIISLWSPSTLAIGKHSKKKINLLSFGMSHKIQIKKFKKLRKLLNSEFGKDYCIRISLALHEYKSFDDEYLKPYKLLKKIFNNNLLFLGFASDDFLSQELKQCDYFIAFFEKGVRDNNSSVVAALEHNCNIITNLDSHSPKIFFNHSKIFNIDKITKIKKIKKVSVKEENLNSYQKSLSWNSLIEKLFNG